MGNKMKYTKWQSMSGEAYKTMREARKKASVKAKAFSKDYGKRVQVKVVKRKRKLFGKKH